MKGTTEGTYCGRNRLFRVAIAGALTLCWALGTANADDAAVSISGKVTFSGPRPVPRELDLSGADNPECEKLHGGKPMFSNKEIVAEDGGVADVFLLVKNPPEGIEHPVPEEAVVLNQIECRYTPHMLGIRVGQTLDVTNSDELTHNVRSFARKNRAFNMGQPGPGVRKKKFTRPEGPIKIKCDIHPWMQSFIFALEHPYFAVSGTDGTYTIEGLPPGQYTIEIWHEVYGKLEASVDASSGSVKDTDFTYAP